MNQFTAPLWGDEGFSAILSMKSIPQIIEIIRRDTSPPLYNITEHLTFRVFGVSEETIRGLSFFYYLLTIFFVFLIAKLIWDKKTALLASALAFFNPFFFIYAFEGRMYAIMALGVASSMYFFLKLLVMPKKAKVRPLGVIIGYILATSWALYSHHFAIFIIFIQGFWWLYELTRKNFKFVKWQLIAFIGAGLLYAPWLLPLYEQTQMVGGGFWLGKPTVRDLRTLIYEYIATGIKHPLADYALYLSFAGLIFRRWDKKLKTSLIMVTWFLGPIVMTFVISQYFQSVFYNRYLLYTIPALGLTMASARRKYVSVVLIAVILGLFIRIDWHYFNNPQKLPFDKLASYVIETKRNNDTLINWSAGSHHLWESKFYGIPAPIYVGENGGELPFFVGTALMEEGDIIKTLPNSGRIGVITSGAVEEVAIAGYTEIESESFGKLNFIWLEKN